MKRFEVVWTDDGWQTQHVTAGRPLGSAGFSADITPVTGSGEVEWTQHWPEEDAWLGYNVKVKIDAP